MRLFVAVTVPAQVAAELEAAVAPLRSSWPGLRWTGRDAWHLTLAFLGEVEEAIAAGLPVELAGAAARHPPLALSLAGSGTFPGADRARVLWTGVQQEGLKKLADAVANAARAAKAPPVEGGEGAYEAGAPPVGGRKFQGHLTLAGRCPQPCGRPGGLRGKPVDG